MKTLRYSSFVLTLLILLTACEQEDAFYDTNTSENQNTQVHTNANKNPNFIDYGCEDSNYKYDFSNPPFTVGERKDLLWGMNGHSIRPDATSTGYQNPYQAITLQETLEMLKKTGTQVYRNDIHVGSNGTLTHGESDSQLDNLITLLDQEGIEFLPMIYTTGYNSLLDDTSTFQYQSIRSAIKFLSKPQVQNIVFNSQIWINNYNAGHQIGRNFALLRGNQITFYNVGNENAYRMIRNLAGIGTGNFIADFFSTEERSKHIVGSTAFTKGVIDGIKLIKSDAICFTTETTGVFGYIDFFNLMDVDYDAIGWNWYSGLGALQSANSGNEHVGLTQGFDVYAKLNQLTNNKPIWLTEINKTHGSTAAQNFDGQADYIRQSMEEMYQLSNIQSYVVYELLDGSNGTTSNEDYFGLVTNPLLGTYDVKPAFNTFRYSVEEFNYGYHDFMYAYYGLYTNNFRPLDNAGIDYWATRFQDGLPIATFLDLYMEVDAGYFVNSMYLLLLDINSDPDGRAYYMERLQSGLTREWLMADIISSASFFSRANNANYGGSSNENFIYHVYQKLLERNPTAQELAQDYFTDTTRDARRNYALSFLNRTEYVSKFITEQYGIYFSRLPDANGLQSYTAQWIDQKDFLIKILTSNEFWRKSVIRGNCARQ